MKQTSDWWTSSFCPLYCLTCLYQHRYRAAATTCSACGVAAHQRARALHARQRADVQAAVADVQTASKRLPQRAPSPTPPLRRVASATLFFITAILLCKSLIGRCYDCHPSKITVNHLFFYSMVLRILAKTPRTANQTRILIVIIGNK